MVARTDQKWSAALIRRMARLADQEMSTAQIAKALGLTRGQVLYRQTGDADESGRR
jgi:hypothetical protein